MVLVLLKWANGREDNSKKLRVLKEIFARNILNNDGWNDIFKDLFEKETLSDRSLETLFRLALNNFSK